LILTKILSIKSKSIFLAVILIAGTIALSSPSFTTTASAQSEPKNYGERENGYSSYESQPRDYPLQYTEREYNNYPSEYEMDIYEKKSYRNDYYEQPREYLSYQQDYKQEYPKFVKDNDGYKSKKDTSSNSVSINKLNCINNNVNINGNNTGDINVGNSGKSATGPGTDEGYLGVGSSGGYGEGYDNSYDKQKDKGFNCIINNNNINNNFGPGNATDGNQTEPRTCEECFRQFLSGTEIAGFLLIFESGLFATLDQVCLNLDLGLISEEEVISALEQVLGTGKDDIINNLIECLLQAGIEFEPEEGNGFNAQGERGSLASFGIHDGGTGDLSALEKTTKLKQQWLGLLP
jgi:hypothetical protein